MASSNPIIQRVVQWASGQDVIRAILLTGSRGSGRPTDALSDYDIVLYASQIGPLLSDTTWIEEFGPVLVRLPAPHQGRPSKRETRLVIYEDGTKIDFTISPLAELRRASRGVDLPDELRVGYAVVLDKDATTAALQAPSGAGFLPRRPSQEEFDALVEEFWWESTYVAKNLRRGELLPAKYSLECVMKLDLLRRLLEWRVEIDHDWTLQPGVLGRGLRPRVAPELWADLEATFVGADINDNWRALLQTTDLFRSVAVAVAQGLGLEYPHALDERVLSYVNRVRELPTLVPDAS